MSDFKAKMHQIRFWLGLHPDPAGEAYSAPPDLVAAVKRAYFKGRGGEGEGREGRGGRGRKGKRKEGKDREREGAPGLSRDRVGNPM